MGLSVSRQDGFTLESLLQYVSVGAPWGLDGQPLKLPDLAVRSSRAFSLIANLAHELYILSPLEENVLILLLGSGVISVFGVPLFLRVCYPYNLLCWVRLTRWEAIKETTQTPS